MGVMYNIRQDLKRDKIRRHYEGKNRLIDQSVYISLKSRKRCMRCKKKFSGRIPEIHHIRPVHPLDGGAPGSNERCNLMAVCARCHKILDAEQKNLNSSNK